MSDRPPAWIEIDIAALVRNARRIVESARVPLLPMVKADAYGLGAVPVARALETLDPWGYGVATVTEGAALREAGISRPIVVFDPLLTEQLTAAHRSGLSPTLGDSEAITEWGRSTGNAPWHLAIDTGMNRAGIRWTEVGDLASAIAQYPPAGACTHFSNADAGDGSAARQLERFRHALGALPTRPPILHAENSPALERLAGPSQWNVVRPGVFLYGVGTQVGLAPEAVVALYARIIDLRWIEPGDSVSYGTSYRASELRRIATVAAGYADGYRRAFGNVGRAIVRGQELRVTGVVTMDMTMLDVTGVDCRRGDVATLLGPEYAPDGPALTSHARLDARRAIDLVVAAQGAGISAYELLTGLRSRLPRVYLGPPSG